MVSLAQSKDKAKTSRKNPKPKASASRTSDRSGKRSFANTAVGRFFTVLGRVLSVGLRLSLVIISVGAIGFAGYKALPYLNPEVKQIVVTGELVRLDQQQLVQEVEEKLQGGILTLDMSRLRDELMAIPWAKNIELIKHFPNTLEVQVYEEKALVRWNNSGYISHEGEFIHSMQYEDLMSLPQLQSARVSMEGHPHSLSNDQAAQVAMSLYHRLNSVVLSEGRQIQSLTESAAGGWTMTWDNGLSIDIGRKDHLQRTRHVMAAWQRLPVEMRASLERIDARYENGVAVRVGNATADTSMKPDGSQKI